MSHRNRFFIVLFELDIVVSLSRTTLGLSVQTKILVIRLISDDLDRSAVDRVLQG